MQKPKMLQTGLGLVAFMSTGSFSGRGGTVPKWRRELGSRKWWSGGGAPAGYTNVQAMKKAVERAARWYRNNPGQTAPGHIQAKARLAGLNPEALSGYDVR